MRNYSKKVSDKKSDIQNKGKIILRKPEKNTAKNVYLYVDDEHRTNDGCQIVCS